MLDDVPWIERLVHDLKGPLAPLQTAAYLLRADGVAPERQRELVEIVDRQSRRLAAMIDEANDWARVGQQRLILRRAPCVLADVLDLAIGGVAGCRVEPAFAPGDAQALQVSGDEPRLVQMFLALIGYQAWRDPGGTATLDVVRAGSHVRVRLCDAGTPMGAAALAALFTEPSPEPHDAGLGLRLMIAAAIASAHGGAVAAADRESGGLCLVCELPIADDQNP